MKIEITNYKLFRQCSKGIIVIFTILSMIIPFGYGRIIAQSDYANIWENFYFYTWGYMGNASINMFFWFMVFLFWTGVILSFGNLKKDGKDNPIIRNLSYIGGLMVLISFFGFMVTMNTVYITIPFKPTDYSRTFGMYTDSIFVLLIIAIVFENLILNKLERSTKPKEEISSKASPTLNIQSSVNANFKFCHLCGIKINKTSVYCEECGTTQ